MREAMQLIAKERERQISDEGWDDLHDDEWDLEQLAAAAACYAMPPSRREWVHPACKVPVDWPWDDNWWKPCNNRIRELEKAGALIAAEIERLQRAALRGEGEG